MKKHWQRDLGSPEKVGIYSIAGLGNVAIQAKDLRSAESYGGDCAVNLTWHKSSSDPGTWYCGSIVPAAGRG